MITAPEYIQQNKWTAIAEAIRSGIPASITLSQGILEADSGNSALAKEANNHFGIKCHSDWYGEHVSANDDLPGECFRKYNSALGSYMDHTRFLRKNPRYNALFSLGMTNYQDWAKGLKTAGYATNPRYDQRLLQIIDKYDLHKYDQVALFFKGLVITAAVILAAILTMLIILKIRSRNDLRSTTALE